jgi:hypothetical protein
MVHAPELMNRMVQADSHAGTEQSGYYMRLLGDKVFSGQDKDAVYF